MPTETLQPPAVPVDLDSLLEMATGLARTAEAWICRLESHPTARTGLRILATQSYDAWLLRWPPGVAVSPHDHGDSNAAFTVAAGALREVRWSDGHRSERRLEAGEGTVVPQGVVHDVVAAGAEALSIHVYSPPLSRMAFFDDRAAFVVFEEQVDGASDLFAPPAGGPASGEDPSVSGVEGLLAQARRRIQPRATPAGLVRALSEGALVVDTRPAALRQRDGEIQGALIVERNVLEWRLDPGGPHRLVEATDPDHPVIVVCDEGYASSLAAAALLDIGRTNVTDLDGGFQALKRFTGGGAPVRT